MVTVTRDGECTDVNGSAQALKIHFSCSVYDFDYSYMGEEKKAEVKLSLNKNSAGRIYTVEDVHLSLPVITVTAQASIF